MATTKPNSIDEYISTFPKDTQLILEQIRKTIKKAVPGVEETISYAMPTFMLNGRYLVYLAAYKNHIGLYPVPTGIEAFEKDFLPYKTSGKGTIQFQLDKPIPLDLITKIVKFRATQSFGKSKAKPKKRMD